MVSSNWTTVFACTLLIQKIKTLVCKPLLGSAHLSNNRQNKKHFHTLICVQQAWSERWKKWIDSNSDHKHWAVGHGLLLKLGIGYVNSWPMRQFDAKRNSTLWLLQVNVTYFATYLNFFRCWTRRKLWSVVWPHLRDSQPIPHHR